MMTKEPKLYMALLGTLKLTNTKQDIANCDYCLQTTMKLLIDRDMNREGLSHQIDLSLAAIAKLRHDGNVTTDVLARICAALGCDVDNICTAVTSKEGEPDE